MYRKKWMTACLTGALVVSVSMSGVPASFAAETQANTQSTEATQNEVPVHVIFTDGTNVVGAGDYFFTPGVHSYSDLAGIIPAGYELTGSGDFFVAEDGSSSYTFNVAPISTEPENAVVNIQFTDVETGEVVKGGDFTLTAGVHSYSELASLVPEGYEMTVSGDFNTADGAIVVHIRKIAQNAIVNIQFTDVATGEVIKGGDFTLTAGVHNYSELAGLVPAGYRMTSSGDFHTNNAPIIVNIEKVSQDVIVNIQFKDSATGEVVKGGDFTLKAGVHNYSELADMVPEGYKMTTSGDFFVKEGTSVVVNMVKIQEDVTMNVRFMDGEVFVAGGDYSIPAGTNNYSVLEQYVPEGYVMTVSGDFYASEGGELTVNVQKVNKEVTMNIRFMDGDTFVAGGDYTLTEGTNNYSVLEQYVPEGYMMTVSGDFMATEGGNLNVSVQKIDRDVIMNIRFMDGEAFIAGGDYKVPEGVNNYSVLEQYVPEGYVMTVSGDFTASEGGVLEVNVEKIQKDVIMNVRFMDGEEFIAGGDYTLPEGVNNYSILEQYVPEGYVMTVFGDFYAQEGASLNVNVRKVKTEVIMNVRFMDGETFVAGGDYTLPEGVNNYAILKQYVPEGYEMTVSGDFFATEGGKLDVNIQKISTDVIMNIRFMDGDTFVAGGDYKVPEGVNNYAILEQYVPEGYEMTVSGDFMATEGGKLDVNIQKIQEDTETETETETETTAPVETETETQAPTETETETATETETEKATETETEKATEKETETKAPETKAPEKDAPKTGDNTPLGAVAGVMSIAGIVAGAVLTILKRK